MDNTIIDNDPVDNELKSEPIDESATITMLKNWFKASESTLKSFRKEARECYRFVSGNQLTDTERAEMREKLRAEIVFNRIDPVISAVVGHQINNRTEIHYLPRENGDVQGAEIYSAAAKWIDEETDSLEEVTEAFWDLCVTGVGFTETRLSYDDDAEGMVNGAERICPLEMGWDIDSKKHNLADAQYMYRGKWWDRKDAIEMWPELKSNAFMEMAELDAGGDDPHDASLAVFYQNDQGHWINKKTDQVFIVQMQYWKRIPMWRVGDTSTGKVIELTQVKYNRLSPRLKDMGIKAVKTQQKQYRQAFFIGDTLLEDKEGPCPGHFTFSAMTGKRDETEKMWYGIVRSMIDPQKWSNKFFSEIQEILSKNRTGGAFVEETALINPRQAEEMWNDPNPLIIVRDGALGQGKIHERNPIQYPAGIDRLLQFAVGSIPHVTGMNMEMMGLVDREQAGVVEMQRKRSAMAIIASFFDALRRHSKQRGRVMLYFIREYLSDGRLIRVVSGSGKEQYVPLLKQNVDITYDIVVSESPYSPDQRAETFAAISQILPVAMKMNFPIPPEVLDYMPLPAELSTKWKQLLAKPPDPMQTKMHEIEMAKQEADTAKAQSTAQLNSAKIWVEKAEAKLLEVEARFKEMETRLKPYEVNSNMMSK